jgi:hypothetical protein
MPTNPGQPLLRSPHTAEALDLRRRSLAVMRDVTIRPELRVGMDRMGLRERRNQMLRTDGRRGLEIAATELIELRNAGATRAELLQYTHFLGEIVEDLCDEEVADPRELELEEVATHLEADALKAHAHLSGEDDQQMITRARACRKHAAAELALARGLEGHVRRRQLGLHDRRLADRRAS